MKNLRSIILAAGKGKRMQSDVPKVLHEICGVPMIQYIQELTKYLGSLKTYIVLGHKSDEIKGCLDKNIVTVLQKKLLGTADAVKTTQRFFKSYRGDVLILCGDTPMLEKETIKRLVRKHKKSNAACTFLTSVVHNPGGYGRIIRGEKGVVIAVREEKDATEFERNFSEINVGVYCFKSQDLFSAIKSIQLNKKKKEFYLTDIIELFVEKGLAIDTSETDGPEEGLGVNSREDLAFAEKVIQKRVLRKLMLEGVTIIDPKTTYINADVKIGRDTIIYPLTVIASNVKIGKCCSIGPFARIRPGSKIGDHTEIGNFTEVSRTKIGNKSLMKHFSFLGDARVGSKVNVGAGVVTANYDGEKKNISLISDHAFVGSDSILVAPVKVGRKATVGAGCVLTKGNSIPDNGLAMGVPGKIIKRRKHG